MSLRSIRSRDREDREEGVMTEWSRYRDMKWLGCLLLLGGLLSSQGCSAYHGQIRETTKSEVKKIVGPGQKGVAVSIRESMLMVERFDLHDVESVPVVTTTETYNKCEHTVLFGKNQNTEKGPREAAIFHVIDMTLSGLFGYVFDVLDSNPMCDQPVVPVLSRVACAFLPLVSCGGDPGGPAVINTSAKEGSRTTATERKRLAGSIQLDIGGERREVPIDSTGLAQVPLEQYVVALLRRGEDRMLARVTIRE